jgi:hypothetical protein
MIVIPDKRAGSMPMLPLIRHDGCMYQAERNRMENMTCLQL